MRRSRQNFDIREIKDRFDRVMRQLDELENNTSSPEAEYILNGTIDDLEHQIRTIDQKGPEGFASVFEIIKRSVSDVVDVFDREGEKRNIRELEKIIDEIGDLASKMPEEKSRHWTINSQNKCSSCGRHIRALQPEDKLARSFRELRVRAADLAYDLDVPMLVDDRLKLLSRRIGAFVEWLEGGDVRQLDTVGIRYRGRSADELVGAALKKLKNTAKELKQDAEGMVTDEDFEPIKYLYEDIYHDQMEWLKGQF